MRAVVYHAREDIRITDVPDPHAGPGQVTLRVGFNGICGSDLHYFFHGANGEFRVREPLIPGHELSATVDLDPSGALAPGTPVTVHPARFGHEVPGIEDRPHLWPGGDYLGSAAPFPHRQGAAAELLVVERDRRPQAGLVTTLRTPCSRFALETRKPRDKRNVQRIEYRRLKLARCFFFANPGDKSGSWERGAQNLVENSRAWVPELQGSLRWSTLLTQKYGGTRIQTSITSIMSWKS